MKTSVAFYFAGCIPLLLLFTVGNVAGQGCSPSPCLNDGICFEVPTGFVCSCASNFTGVTCETALGEGSVMCEHNSCANEGDCLITDGAIECKCTTDYTGPKCETPVNIIASTALPEDPVMCEFNSCANGGDCLITDGAIECKCTTDFTGPKCGTPVNIIASTATTSTPPITMQTSGSSQEITSKTTATSQTIRQTKPSSISNPSGGTVSAWVIIIAAVAAVTIIIVVLTLFVMIMTGGKNEGNRLSNSNPLVTSEISQNIPEGDSASMDNDLTAENNSAYDPYKLDSYDDPPPNYDDERSINGFCTPEPRLYDDFKVSLTRRDPCPTNDYGDLSRSDDDGFSATLY